MKTGNFVVEHMGELIEDIIDLRNIPGYGLRLEISFLKTKYLITREKIRGTIYTMLWEETSEKEWEEQARAINTYYIAKILMDYATFEGADYYEIKEDKFTRMEGL